ncbi:hypothetical protein SAMN05216167_14512 [Spirosoma endophyticum]|uniref:Uncharacterized protein n=1 Tax=Spirosoma endophyticum TaxID=662367 RepID=A0A1I2HPE5_9BACT|nr:hypothetical protein SAMN05216167_14512 [Spirosoma endophyticum]
MKGRFYAHPFNKLDALEMVLFLVKLHKVRYVKKLFQDWPLYTSSKNRPNCTLEREGESVVLC